MTSRVKLHAALGRKSNGTNANRERNSEWALPALADPQHVLEGPGPELLHRAGPVAELARIDVHVPCRCPVTTHGSEMALKAAQCVFAGASRTSIRSAALPPYRWAVRRMENVGTKGVLVPACRVMRGGAIRKAELQRKLTTFWRWSAKKITLKSIVSQSVGAPGPCAGTRSGGWW